MDKHLRNRPFMVIEFTNQPREGVNTSVKGWQDKPDAIRVLEHVAIVDRINKKQMNAPVIIDLVSGEVLHNRTGKHHAEIAEHYIARYQDTITQALKKWATIQMNKALAEESLAPLPTDA